MSRNWEEVEFGRNKDRFIPFPDVLSIKKSVNEKPN